MLHKMLLTLAMIAGFFSLLRKISCGYNIWPFDSFRILAKALMLGGSIAKAFSQMINPFHIQLVLSNFPIGKDEWDVHSILMCDVMA